MPAEPRPRLALLDALRGLGVLGILAVNAAFMAATFEQAADPRAWPFPGEGASLAAWFVVHVFFESKFVTLFAMLFGVSCWLVGGAPGDAAEGRALRRRLGWLAVFGLAHGALVWYGDILLDYAACGFAVMRLRGLDARQLLVAGAAAFAAGVAWMAWGGASAFLLPSGVPGPEAFQGGFAASLRANAQSWWGHRPLVAFFTLPYCAPLMLVGLGLFKAGALTGEAPRRVYLGFVAAGALALAFVGAFTAAHLRDGAAEDPLLLNVTSPFVSLGYVGAFALASRTRAGAAAVRLLAPLGRMAFTNYIGQSVAMTALFYGGRGPGLFDRVDRPALLALAAGVCLLQLAGSHAWLRRFELGPLEAGWHRLTHGRG